MNFVYDRRVFFPIFIAVLTLLISCVNISKEDDSGNINDQALPLSAAENLNNNYSNEDSNNLNLHLNKLTAAHNVLEAQDFVLSKIYSDSKKSVVSIRTTEKIVDYWSMQQFETDLGQGSGFVWDKSGHIVTNNHVIEGASRIIVVMADGKELLAEVIGTDVHSDIAVIRIIGSDDSSIELLPITIGDSAEVIPGQMTVALGNPFAQHNTMTTGIVSAIGRTIKAKDSLFSITEVIQTDAAINPGNSGGPLLNYKGEAIGVNYMIVSAGGSSSGIGFAIPIDIAKRVIPSLIDRGIYEYSYLGVGIGNITDNVALKMKEVLSSNVINGAALSLIYPNTPAEDAGLMVGDVVLNINKILIRNADDLLVFLNTKTSPGDLIEIELFSRGEVVKRSVILGVRPK
jgi:2-alkenal reductase